MPATLMAETWHIVLPTKTASSDELSDADLEKLAGGTQAAVSGAIVGSIVIVGLTASAMVTIDKAGW